MELAGDQIDRDIDDRKADRSMEQRLNHTFLNRRDIVARDGPADDAVGIGKAGAARQRFHLDRYIGELSVPAALTFEAGMLLGSLPDRLLVGDPGAPAVDREVVAAAQAVDGNLQMDVALPPQDHFLRIGILFELEGGVLLDQLADCACQLDVVGAPLGGDREAVGRLRTFRLRQWRGLAGRGQDGAGGDLLHSRQPDNLARLSSGNLLLLSADQAQQAGDAAAVQHHAFGDRAAPDPNQRQLAGVRQVIGLEHLRQRLAFRSDPQPLGGLPGRRRLMAQRLPQPPYAKVRLPRAEKHRHHLRALQGAGQVLVDLLLGRFDLFEQLLEQGVVKIGELLDQPAARRPFLFPEPVGQRDKVRRLARSVTVGALADQVDIAGDLAIRPAQRHLTQHERALGDRLQGGQQIAHPRARVVHLVDEDHVRDLVPVEKPQESADRQGALDLRLDDDHRDVADQQRRLRLIEQLDRARAVEDGPAVAEKTRAGDVELRRHLPGARFRRMVPDRVAVAHTAAPAGAAADVQ